MSNFEKITFKYNIKELHVVENVCGVVVYYFFVFGHYCIFNGDRFYFSYLVS